MKKLTKQIWYIFMVVILLVIPLSVIVAQDQTPPQTQTEQVVSAADSTKTLVHEKKTFVQELKDSIIAIAILGFIVMAVIYMVIELRRKFYIPVTVADMKNKRTECGVSSESSDSENDQALDLLETIFDGWKVVTGPEDAEELRAPRKRVHIDKSVKILNEVKQIMPTNEDVVNRMNELGEVININAKRHFAGSYKLLLVAGAVLVFFYFTMGGEGFFKRILQLWWIWGSMLFYYFASYAPQFLIEKRQQWFGNSNISSGLVSFFAAFFLAAPTITTVTTWSDGSKTKETDGNWFGLIIMVIGLLIIGIGIIFFGILNFLRNYVIYA
jgi:hypothetical protein